MATATDLGMQTKARIAGHPIHPMLVAFPIGLYAATVAALLAFIGTKDPFFYRAAMTANIAAVVMAALAAIPGTIDLFTLPSDRTDARRTGYLHAAFNVLALLLFLISAVTLYDHWTARPLTPLGAALDATVPLALSVAGLVSTVIAGGLGWAMVQTHHVGVLPRAQAEGMDLTELGEEPSGVEIPVTKRRPHEPHVHH